MGGRQIAFYLYDIILFQQGFCCRVHSYVPFSIWVASSKWLLNEFIPVKKKLCVAFASIDIEKETQKIYTKLLMVLSLEWQDYEGVTLLQSYFSVTNIFTRSLIPWKKQEKAIVVTFSLHCLWIGPYG